MYLTDTHPWLWFLSSDPRLSKRAEGIFNSAEMGEEIIVIPSIVVAEAIYITAKKGYHLEMKDIINDIETSSNYTMIPMDYPIVKSISTDDRDFTIHDKIIVHTAEKEGYSIISRDKNIRKNSKVEVIW